MRKVQNFIEPEYAYRWRQAWNWPPLKNKRRAYVGKKYRRLNIIELPHGLIIDGVYMPHLEW